MKKSFAFIAALLIAAGTVLVTGCVQERAHHHPSAVATAGAGDEIVVTEAPPTPMAESITISPGAGYVWIPGAWDWRGSAWVWVHGQWAHPPAPGAVWVAHRYEERNGTHVFIRGGWRY